MDKVVISDAQFAVYKSDFDKADLNGDGVLEEDEVSEMLKLQLGSAPKADQVSSFMAAFDKDGDGRITVEEWIGAIIGKKYSVSPEMVRTASAEASENPDCLDKDGEPICVGLIYEFVGGG